MEKGILFATDMVQAILSGSKSQTRRLINPQPSEGAWPIYDNCPFGQTGDILWVRETWYYEEHMHDMTTGEPDLPSGRYSHRYIYKADNPDYPVDVGVGQHGWRPSIHMPREAARLFLHVKNVGVERLQEITEGNARAEGVNPSVCPPFDELGHRLAFKDLWDSIYSKRGHGWDANPWVWVVEFERLTTLPVRCHRYIWFRCDQRLQVL